MFSVKLIVYTLLYMGIEETPFTKWYDRSARFTTYMKYSSKSGVKETLQKDHRNMYLVQINSLKQSDMPFSSVAGEGRTHSLNNQHLPLWLVEEEYFSSTLAKGRNGQIMPCLMSATDWCLDLYFSQHLALSKTYTLPQKAGKYNPVIFQMGEQERLQKIVSDSAGNKTQGPNHLSDLHKMYSNARENVFSEGVLNSC